MGLRSKSCRDGRIHETQNGECGLESVEIHKCGGAASVFSLEPAKTRHNPPPLRRRRETFLENTSKPAKSRHGHGGASVFSLEPAKTRHNPPPLRRRRETFLENTSKPAIIRHRLVQAAPPIVASELFIAGG
jgi:hypothetical protein